jgi:hypothetical protein
MFFNGLEKNQVIFRTTGIDVENEWFGKGNVLASGRRRKGGRAVRKMHQSIQGRAKGIQ